MVPLTSRTAEPAALVVHASRLLELLAGVTTRLQLGRHAYERGWVTRT
ncbi:hypothetical protein ACFYZB_22000 [Streptomyces sp. NPDC001852]